MKTLKTPSMHCTLGSATLLQLVFPWESIPNLPREKSHWDNAFVKSVVVFVFSVFLFFFRVKSKVDVRGTLRM